MAMSDREERDDAKLSAFYEWKKECAYEKCSEGSQYILREYGRWRFNKWVDKLSHEYYGLDFLGEEGGEYAWLLVEEHALDKVYKDVKKLKEKELLGKRYKDGIFYKVTTSDDPPLKVIHGYLRVMYQDIVRKQCLKIDNTVSLDAPLGAGEEFSLEELLPDRTLAPDYDLHISELQGIAEKEVTEIFQDLQFREKILILSKHDEINRPTSDPLVLKIAETKKSTMGDINKRFYTNQQHLNHLDEKYEDEGGATLAHLKSIIQNLLKNIIYLWAQSEIRCKPLLDLAGADNINDTQWSEQ